MQCRKEIYLKVERWKNYLNESKLKSKVKIKTKQIVKHYIEE